LQVKDARITTTSYILRIYYLLLKTTISNTVKLRFICHDVSTIWAEIFRMFSVRIIQSESCRYDNEEIETRELCT